jgi:hypothetical protein
MKTQQDAIQIPYQKEIKWELLPIPNDEFLISDQIPNPNGQSNPKPQNTNYNFDASEYEFWKLKTMTRKTPNHRLYWRIFLLSSRRKLLHQSQSYGYHYPQTDIFAVSETSNARKNLELSPKMVGGERMEDDGDNSACYYCDYACFFLSV